MEDIEYFALTILVWHKLTKGTPQVPREVMNTTTPIKLSVSVTANNFIAHPVPFHDPA